MFDVRLTEEYQAKNSEWTQRTGEGELAAMEIGAALGATACQTMQDKNLIAKEGWIRRATARLPSFIQPVRTFFAPALSGSW
jgi:hypothetical protein